MKTLAKEKYDMRLKRLLGGKLSYDVFRSEICHMYHFDGDYEFISKVMRVNLVMVLWNNHEYDKALYTLAMIDYISWKNGVMLYEGYFDAKTKIHLLNYIESRTDNNIALFVSLNKPHSRLTESGVELRLREMGKKLGVEKVHPHKFRRTMATRAIEKGMPIEQVQKILGHEQIDTTLRYAMVNQNNVKLSHRKYIS